MMTNHNQNDDDDEPKHSNFQLTVFIHGRLKALGQSAGSTLIPMRFVDGASSFQVSRCLARVNPIPMDAPLEEARTTVATVDAIMFARAPISAHFARNIQKSVA